MVIESKVILLVDGGAQLRKVCSDILASAGYTVFEADNAMDALLATAERNGAIDILLLSRNLPRVTEDELTEAFRLLWPRIDVVSIDNTVEGPGSGANSITVNKPMLAELLLDAVRRTPVPAAIPA
ncbi:MAG TPA: hypothetical protein VJN43_01575 [Bryobacteraceae bacterium]|nr:hypothetical protein [Bryobacteraceae bacterium]